MADGPGERAFSAARWSLSGDVVEQGIRSLFAIVLARLLAPRDFGQLAMLMVFTQFGVSISGLGFEEALVQQRDLDETHRSSVFWTMLGVGAALTVGLIAGAPWIAAFYGVEKLLPLARVVSALFVLDALGTVPRALLARRLDFRVVARLQCVAASVACACTVTLAWIGVGVMSLAADPLITTGLEALLFFRVSAWRPQLQFRAAALRELLGFSSYRLAGRALGYSTQLDQLLVGKFLGSGVLGLYARAYNLTRFPVLYVSRSIGRGMFPSLASMQHDPAQLRDIYVRTTAAVALVALPICMGLFAAAQPLVLGILGPQWRDTIPILRIMSLAGAAQSIAALATSLYLALGRADLQLRLTALQRLSTIAAIIFGLHWGVLGVATAYAVAAVVNMVPMLYFACRLIGLRTEALLSHVRSVFVASLLMAAVVLGIDTWIAPRPDTLGALAIEVVTGILVYWVGLRCFRAAVYFDAISWLRQRSAPAQQV